MVAKHYYLFSVNRNFFQFFFTKFLGRCLLWSKLHNVMPKSLSLIIFKKKKKLRKPKENSNFARKIAIKIISVSHEKIKNLGFKSKWMPVFSNINFSIITKF